MRIAVVGLGKAGTALAVRWLLAGHELAIAVHRESSREHHEAYLSDAVLLPAAEAAHTADVVVLGVPDARIGAVCEGLQDSFAPGRTVAHLSGATPLSALDPARAAGASRLSLHPLQTFPSVEAAVGRLAGSAMAVTADDEETAVLGERLAADAGCRPFRLADDAKPLYHSAAVLASNAVVAVLAEAAEVFARAGLSDPSMFLPLVRASVDNVGELGPEAALTGPVVRGDAGTVERNLAALAEARPDAVAPYLALARMTLDLARHSGRLPAAGAAAVEEVLARWST